MENNIIENNITIGIEGLVGAGKHQFVGNY